MSAQFVFDNEEEEQEKMVKKSVIKNNNKKMQKNKKRKLSSKIVAKSYNSGCLIHCLNDYYGDDYKFKKEDDKGKKNIIVDISKYEALNTLAKNIKICEQQITKSKITVKPQDKWSKICHSIWDFKLRGILTDMYDNNIDYIDASTGNTFFVDYIVPQLKINETKQFEQQKVVDKIISFVTGPEMPFKLYNIFFPHPVASIEKQSQGLDDRFNKVYLQNRSMFHDAIVNKIYTEKADFDTLFKYVCEQINPSADVNKITNYDFTLVTTGKIPAEDKELTETLKKANYEKNCINRYLLHVDSCLQQKLIDVKQLKTKYNEYVKIVKFIVKESQALGKLPQNTIADFVDFFVKMFKLISPHLNYGNSIIKFIKECKIEKDLLFTAQFKKLLNRMIAGEETGLSINGNTFTSNIIMNNLIKPGEEPRKLSGDVIVMNNLQFNKLYNQLAKIGSYIDNNVTKIPKLIKAGVGIAIVDYIRENIEKNNKSNSKQKKCVGIAF